MNIYLTGASGGIGSAIKNYLKDCDYGLNPYAIDWIIFAHGVINENDIEETFEVNTLKCIRQTFDLLPLVRHGIIFISSTAAITANSKFPIYSASKAAINVFAESMAKAYPEKKFYALCPGPTNTKMWQRLGLEGEAQDPIEVAKAIKRIIDGEFESGSIITVRKGEVVCL